MKKVPYHIVRNSKIHGRGVFARRPIRKGVKIIEYTGKIISREEADEIGTETTEAGHSHTMLFTVDEERVIDGRRGNAARYINHSCAPNCEAVQYGDQIFIEALRSIPKGQELTYDYHLDVPGKITKKVLEEYICLCGTPECRGTQIAQANIDRQLEKRGGKKLKKALEAIQAERRQAAQRSDQPLPAPAPEAVKVPAAAELFVDSVTMLQRAQVKKDKKKKTGSTPKDMKKVEKKDDNKAGKDGKKSKAKKSKNKEKDNTAAIKGGKNGEVAVKSKKQREKKQDKKDKKKSKKKK